MVTRLQGSLLMLITLLSQAIPPGEPPGSGAMAAPRARTVPCTNPDCGSGRGRWQEGFVYWCRSCDQTFNYCTTCRTGFLDGQEAEHSHPTA
jgi:hypothetical protein